MTQRNHHKEWRGVRAALNKLTEEQLGKLIFDAIETYQTSEWPDGLTNCEYRAGVLRFLVAILKVPR